MEVNKQFVVSGCSFTFENWNWPTFVAEKMNWKLLNVAMGSQGNGLISKKLIYNVDCLLKDGISEDNIIAGIMWSGPDRFEFYNEDDVSLKNIDGWIENPTNVISDDTNSYKNWIIVNPHWKTYNSEKYYQLFHHSISSMIFTIQNILLTQWYLERKGIWYFMTTYLDIFDKSIINHPDVKYWFDMIDFTKFIPIKGCHEWVSDNYGNGGGFNTTDKSGYVGIHPTEFGHRKFSEEVMIPFIIDNYKNK
jgi:hypothetical protein